MRESKKLFKIKCSTEIRKGDKEPRQKEKYIDSENKVRCCGRNIPQQRENSYGQSSTGVKTGGKQKEFQMHYWQKSV